MVLVDLSWISVFLFKDHTHIPDGFVKNSTGYFDYNISESSSIEIFVYILK